MPKRAMVMAGGKATRLHPLTHALNKHVLPVHDKPMIHWVIDALVKGGATDVLVVLNNSHAQQVMEVLEDGEEYGCAISYAYQREPAGLMKHIQAGRTFARGEDFVLMLGDSLYLEKLSFRNVPSPHMWVMPIGDFDEIGKYAQVEVTASGRVVSMTEKPLIHVTGIIQTGCWVFPPDVFDRAARLYEYGQKQDKEIQLRTLVHEYILEDKMTATELPANSFLDLGTLPALQKGNEILKSRCLTPRLVLV